MDTETQNKIDEIMDYFDFNKVVRQWFDGVPDEPTVRSSARGLLRKAALDPRPESYIATGGFRAEKFLINNETHFKLSFGIDWDTYHH